MTHVVQSRGGGGKHDEVGVEGGAKNNKETKWVSRDQYL